MKVFAIYTLRGPLTPELQQQVMPKEVPATLKHYLEGKIEQFWFREKAGPIFLLNVASLDEAKAAMDSLPLVVGKHATYELWPVSPLLPLGLLLQGK
jgi:hypothetical protein